MIEIEIQIEKEKWIQKNSAKPDVKGGVIEV